MKKILIIIPYFGKFPNLFSFWKASAINNPTVNFLLITDNNMKSESNIKVINSSLTDIKNKINLLFDFEISLDSPYKLCDYKPAYGFIFKDEIKNYDFWGFGDIDLIYGDIRYFITEDILSKFKCISGWGHLTLYKNEEECNSFFRKEINETLNFKDVFSSKKQFVFDEYYHGGCSDKWLKEYNNDLYQTTAFDDLIIPRNSWNFKSYGKQEEYNNLIFIYESKNLYRVYNKNNRLIIEKSLYVHLQQRSFIKIKTLNTQSYIMIPNKIIQYKEFDVNYLIQVTKEKKYNILIYKIYKKLKRIHCLRWINFLPY